VLYLSLIALGAIALRLIAIPYFGFGLVKYPVDVYYVDREAANLILLFRNPYLYSDFTNRIGHVVTFAYMPLIPVYFAPFELMGWNIRYGSVVADVAILVAMYFIANSLLERNELRLAWIPLTGSIAYALLPISILLTSVFATNMMIGAMFLVVGIAALFYKRWILSGVLLGLALATNQFMIFVLPIITIYCLRKSNVRPALVSILLAGAIVLPFLLYSPSSFLQDVVYFQFQRPLQTNGTWSLYYIVYALTGYGLVTPLRILIFAIPSALVSVVFSTGRKKMLTGIAIVLGLATFVLPIDGFWNYFLLPSTIACSIVPLMITNRHVVRASPYLRKHLSSPNPILGATRQNQFEN
jgi:uncharacterized membrane protein